MATTCEHANREARLVSARWQALIVRGLCRMLAAGMHLTEVSR